MHYYSYEHLFLLVGRRWRRKGFEPSWPRCGCTFANLLPRRQRFKVAESLCELKRLIHNPFSFLIVANLSVSSQREILTHRMSLKAVVSENPTQIWVTTEEHSIHVPYFPLIPISASEEIGHTRDMVAFTSIGLDPDAALRIGAQEMVHDLKTFVALWEVDGGDMHQVFELTL